MKVELCLNLLEVKIEWTTVTSDFKYKMMYMEVAQKKKMMYMEMFTTIIDLVTHINKIYLFFGHIKKIQIKYI